MQQTRSPEEQAAIQLRRREEQAQKKERRKQEREEEAENEQHHAAKRTHTQPQRLQCPLCHNLLPSSNQQARAVHLLKCAHKTLKEEYPSEHTKVVSSLFPSSSASSSSSSTSTTTPAPPQEGGSIPETTEQPAAAVRPRGTTTSSFACKGCGKGVSLAKKGKIEVTISKGNGRKLYWCDHTHFKSGSAHLEVYVKRIEGVLGRENQDMGRRTLCCTGCKRKCTNTLSVSADKAYFFCMAHCLVAWLSSCGVGEWKKKAV